MLDIVLTNPGLDLDQGVGAVKHPSTDHDICHIAAFASWPLLVPRVQIQILAGEL